MNMHRQYRVSYGVTTTTNSLVDRGANGGLAGSDVRVLERSEHTADVSGLAGAKVSGLTIGTVAGCVHTNMGKVVVIMHQYAIYGEGKTIHSPIQLEAFGHEVRDKSYAFGGLQSIRTSDGTYTIPLDIEGGLAYMPMYPPTDDDLANLPAIVLTSDQEWNPSIADHRFDRSSDSWIQDLDIDPNHAPHRSSVFDDRGELRVKSTHPMTTRSRTVHVSEVTPIDFDNPLKSNLFDWSFDHIVDDDLASYVADCVRSVHLLERHGKTPDFERLRPYFAYARTNVVERTFKATTQYGRY